MLTIGLDAGGSKTDLIALQEGTPVVSLSGAASNPQRVGMDTASRVLVALILQALQQRPTTSVRVCAGVAGAGRSTDQKYLAAEILESLRARGINAEVEVVNDAVIALDGAFDGESGAIVISGTGSIVLGRQPDGASVRTGGWGFMIGDEGSGHAIGVAAIRAVAGIFDGAPDSLLRTLLEDRFSIIDSNSLILRVYRDHLSMPTVAPLVIEAAEVGDQLARTILETQAGLLADQVVQLFQKAPDVAPQLAFLGGIARHTYYNRLLKDACVERLPHITVVEPKGNAIDGALARASRLTLSAS